MARVLRLEGVCARSRGLRSAHVMGFSAPDLVSLAALHLELRFGGFLRGFGDALGCELVTNDEEILIYFVDLGPY